MTPKQKHRWIIQVTAEYIKNTVPGGQFVECGVKQGTASRIMGLVLQGTGYLFDTWTDFPHYSKYDVSSKKRIRRLNRRVRKMPSTYEDCKNAMEKHGLEKLCHMIKGDICKTVPKFVKEKYKDLSICMVHIDTDLHDPACVSLKHFYKHVLLDGIILFHDYTDPKWPGITKVVNSFVRKHDWGFVDMNSVMQLRAAAIVNGDPAMYRDYVEREWLAVRSDIEK